MIIDSHAHLGTMIQFDLPLEKIIKSMETYGVTKAVLSNLEGAEFDSDLNLLPPEVQVTQDELNLRTLKLVKTNEEAFKGLYWIKPHTEGYHAGVEEFIQAHRANFSGLKAHPFHSNLPFTDAKYRPYLECARRNNLTVVVHTAKDELSRPELVYEVAKDYPEVTFVLVHMGMGTEQDEAIECIQKLPNLYGDTSWVKWPNIIKAVQACGSEKILFGTDSPVALERVAERYLHDIEMLKANLAPEELENIFYRNALKLFW